MVKLRAIYNSAFLPPAFLYRKAFAPPFRAEFGDGLKAQIIESLETGTFIRVNEHWDLNFQTYVNYVRDEIKKVGRELKNANNTALITHILDREFDDNEYMNVISEDLSQDYIIRAKKSRTIEEKREDGKKIKLIEENYC